MKALVRSISVSAMPFNSLKRQNLVQQFARLLCPALTWVALFILPYSVLPASAELIDRVIAFVDDRAITLREFNEYYDNTVKIKPDITRGDLLNTYINRLLLLREAKKLKIEARTEDELLNEYIELKVKAFIRIREEEIRAFYDSNISEFKDLSYESVRDKIEDYLIQLELNRLLKRHINELRTNSYIKILNQATLP